MTAPARPADHVLVALAREGDGAAFAALVERHYALLLTSARRFLADRDGDGDTARDAAQEAVLRALLGLDRLRDKSQFGSWLIGIGLNVCRSLIVAERRRPGSLDALVEQGRLPDTLASQPQPLDAILARDLGERVRSAVANLPPGQRHTAVLFYLAGLTHAEVAAELGTSPGAVKTRLHNARRSLRVSLFTTYQEYIHMPDPVNDLIPMRVAELRRTAAPEPGAERHIVFLSDDGDPARRLPIWIGAAEATQLAVILEDVELPRPGVHQFAAALLDGAGGQLSEVRVTALTRNTFYAQAVLADGTTIDARPSDALTLALLAGCPIYVAEAVLRQSDAHADRFADLRREADSATDDARTIAAEVRARSAAIADELARRE